jgi:hypothetical protein
MLSCLYLPDWLLKPEYVTFATWFLVIATAVLAVVTFWQGRKEQKRWQRDDEQARIREKGDRLNELIGQFNSPLLLITRAELAYQLIEEPQTSLTGIELGPKLRFKFPNQTPLQA